MTDNVRINPGKFDDSEKLFHHLCNINRMLYFYIKYGIEAVQSVY
jgi:hypothetical protein